MNDRRTVPHAALAFLLIALSAVAHDTGFGHSSRTLHVAATATGFRLEYRLRMNPDEALVEMTLMDTDHDGTVSQDERQHYLSQRSRELADGLRLTDPDTGKTVAIAPQGCRLGPSLTQTYLFEVTTSARRLAMDDRNFVHKHGQLTAYAGPGIVIAGSDAASLFHIDRVQLILERHTTP